MRSNGTVTYVGKDMAYQFWKSGLLGKDFSYRRFARGIDGSDLWATTSRADDAEAVAPGVRRRAGDLQRHRRAAVVPAEAAEAGARRGRASRRGRAADALLVRDGGAVARDRARAGLCAARPTPTTAKRPFVEVSGRKGLGVKADDLIDRVFAKALTEVERRNPELPDAERRRIAEHDRRRCGALLHDQVFADQGHRLRHRRGPELRGRERPVSAVRGRARQQHLPEAPGALGRDASATCWPRCAATPPEALLGTDGDHELWNLVLEAVAARRCRRTGGAIAGVCGAGEVRVSGWRRCSTASITGPRF